MKRESIMTTYKNLIEMNKSFDMVLENKQQVTVNPEVIAYAEKFGKKEAYLFNNRLFRMYINPSDLRKEEYNVNWKYINSLKD